MAPERRGEMARGGIGQRAVARVTGLPPDYPALLDELKRRIRAVQLKAAVSVNRELIALYWHIGKSIAERQRSEGWGKSVVDRLATDLQQEFPGMAGFSPSNIWRMRAFYLAWTGAVLAQAARESEDPSKLAQPVRELGVAAPPTEVTGIPWGHNVILVQKVKDPAMRLWYARQALEHGWSRAVLVHQIESDLFKRQGKAVTNFQATLPPPQSDLAQQVLIAGAHHAWRGDKGAGKYSHSDMHTSGWTEVRLGDLVSITHGWPFRGDLCSEELTGKPIVVNIGNFQYTGGFRFQSTTLREYRGEYPKEYELTPGDILLIMTCQTPGGEILGVPARVPDDGRTYLHNQRLGKAVVVDPDAIDPDFLYWLFRSPEFNRELYLTASGTKILHTAPKRIEAHRFRLPWPDEQRPIGHILGTLDDKIELNRGMNETLEAMARAIFKSWFVDFDPVRARAAGRQPAGMDAATAALSPAVFEDSDLGSIPRGWRVMQVRDVCEFAYGKALKEEDRRPGPVAVFGSNGRVGSHDERLVRGPGIVVGRKGNPGTVRWSSSDFFPIDTTFYVVPKPACESLHYLFHALDGLDLPSLSADSAVPGLNRDMAYMSSVLVPLPALLRVFDQVIARLRTMQELCDRQSDALAALRDALLPKLLSGQIRVREAEKVMGARV